MSMNEVRSPSKNLSKNELDFSSDENESSDSDNSVSLNKFIGCNKKMDPEDDSDEEINEMNEIKKAANNTKNQPTKNQADRQLTDYLFANVETYSFKTWCNFFPDKKVKLRSLVFNPAWNEFFDLIEKKSYFRRMEEILSEYLVKNKDAVIPYPELVFNPMNVLSPSKIKNVRIGQDPYPTVSKINGQWIPEAMGFSFSVPRGHPKPRSLENIYQNMLEYKHLSKIPETGCLATWVMQGCFMINASLTTFAGKRNAHANVWKHFTNDLLAYINNKCNNVVFNVWGKDAHLLCLNIDPVKHCVITSSHPSPLGFDKTFSGFVYGPVKNSKNRKVVTYPPFKTIDHCGLTNEYLKSVNKGEIMWDLLDI